MPSEHLPQVPDEVRLLQEKISILKWVRDARAVLPNLPESSIRKDLEFQIESILKEGKSLESVNRDLRLQVCHLTSELASKHVERHETSDQSAADTDTPVIWPISRLKWFLIGCGFGALILFAIVTYLQSHQGQ